MENIEKTDITEDINTECDTNFSDNLEKLFETADKKITDKRLEIKKALEDEKRKWEEEKQKEKKITEAYANDILSFISDCFSNPIVENTKIDNHSVMTHIDNGDIKTHQHLGRLASDIWDKGYPVGMESFYQIDKYGFKLYLNYSKGFGLEHSGIHYKNIDYHYLEELLKQNNIHFSRYCSNTSVTRCSDYYDRPLVIEVETIEFIIKRPKKKDKVYYKEYIGD